MKTVLTCLVLALVIMGVVFLIPSQIKAKKFGGVSSIQLQENYKLVNATWKDSNIWILTRPMKDNEESETYTFKEYSAYGLFEGAVNIVEKKK